MIDVGADTPAERAGLLSGDRILNPEVFVDDYAPGARLLLHVVRTGVELPLTVAVGKICQD